MTKLRMSNRATQTSASAANPHANLCAFRRSTAISRSEARAQPMSMPKHASDRKYSELTRASSSRTAPNVSKERRSEDFEDRAITSVAGARHECLGAGAVAGSHAVATFRVAPRRRSPDGKDRAAGAGGAACGKDAARGDREWRGGRAGERGHLRNRHRRLLRATHDPAERTGAVAGGGRGFPERSRRIDFLGSGRRGRSVRRFPNVFRAKRADPIEIV
jgi:hypothetical protein